jgi:hypothetical protein
MFFLASSTLPCHNSCKDLFQKRCHLVKLTALQLEPDNNNNEDNFFSLAFRYSLLSDYREEKKNHAASFEKSAGAQFDFDQLMPGSTMSLDDFKNILQEEKGATTIFTED